MKILLDSEASLSGIGLHGNSEDSNSEDSVQAMASMPSGAAATPILHAADATIVAIESASIKLAHGPFASLNMPGMTMAFGYSSKDIDAKAFAVGDAVRVWLREDASTRIHRAHQRHRSP